MRFCHPGHGVAMPGMVAPRPGTRAAALRPLLTRLRAGSWGGLRGMTECTRRAAGQGEAQAHCESNTRDSLPGHHPTP